MRLSVKIGLPAVLIVALLWIANSVDAPHKEDAHHPLGSDDAHKSSPHDIHSDGATLADAPASAMSGNGGPSWRSAAPTTAPLCNGTLPQLEQTWRRWNDVSSVDVTHRGLWGVLLPTTQELSHRLGTAGSTLNEQTSAEHVDGVETGISSIARANDASPLRWRRRLHLHLISLGDSLISGFVGRRPYMENLTETSHSYTPPLMRLLHSALENEAALQHFDISSSYEYHGFPATISKKILYTLRRRFALGGDCNKTVSTVNSMAAFEATNQGTKSPAPDAAADAGGTAVAADNETVTKPPRVSHRKKPKQGGARGYKATMEQKEDDDEEPGDGDNVYRDGVFHIQRRLSSVLLPDASARTLRSVSSSASESALPRHHPQDASDSASLDRSRPPPDVVVVVCSVLAGINDAMLGIPFWWVKRNLQSLHNLCRKRATDATLASAAFTKRRNASGQSNGKGSALSSSAVTIVVSVPMRMVPPYYFLIDGKLAQTRRVAKRNLDPSGICEFWFRSPRRKLNLQQIVRVVNNAAENSSYPSASIEEYFQRRKPTPAPASMDGSGGGDAATHNNNATAARSPCVVYRQRDTDEEKTLCYFTRDIMPIDRIFIFPDKLVASALWRAALNMWSDCIHPSHQGYERMAEKIGKALRGELVELLRAALTTEPPPRAP